MQDRGQTGTGRHAPNDKEDTMTAAMPSNRPPVADPQPSVDERAGRAMTTLSPAATLPPSQPVARSIHDARRLRQAGDLDGALAALAGADTARAATPDARWAYAEWLGLARRRLGEPQTLVYSPGTGRAAALTPGPDGALQVIAVLGMRWRPGTVVSRRSLRGLKPLRGGTA